MGILTTTHRHYKLANIDIRTYTNIQYMNLAYITYIHYVNTSPTHTKLETGLGRLDLKPDTSVSPLLSQSSQSLHVIPEIPVTFPQLPANVERLHRCNIRSCLQFSHL